MTICPCCGFKSEAVLNRTLNDDCQACGARSVGEPLPRPEHELPSYGRSLVIVVTGTLMVLIFMIQTVIVLVQRSPGGDTSKLAFASIVPLDFWSWVAAAETASWRLKWIMIPITILIVFGSRKLYRSIAHSPARFCGVRYARNGYLASAAVPLLVLILIGVTVPERLRQRQRGIDAGVNALAYTFDRAIFEYRSKFERVPNELSDLKQLPDADGSIAAALNSLDPVAYPNAYRPSAEVAAKQKPRTLRGAVIRNASINTAPDDTLGEGLSFTNYELRLPGPDKLMGTDDDLLVRDGVITKAPATPRRGNNSSTTTQRR
ncbi:MAG: hypothetical protein M3R67_06485 [Acidobacteriota bacterium]|nr:hypothetical protein [Acidobacteriota bacterium]